MKDTSFCSKIVFNARGKLVRFNRPIIMGILNSTPDSFFEGSRVNTESGLAVAREMIHDGADIIDIGGYSSRPGAKEVSVSEEIERVVPLISAIRSEFEDILISIDTFRPEVAQAALKVGADIINDISGGQHNEEIYSIAAQFSAPYILMHMRGTPENMSTLTDYSHLIKDLQSYFSNQIDKAKKAGVKDLIIDPGFGFAKTIDQNYSLMKKLDTFQLHGFPVLVGISRKSMIYKKLEVTAGESLNGTTALNMYALNKGAAILRVHDVRAAKETLELALSIRDAE